MPEKSKRGCLPIVGFGGLLLVLVAIFLAGDKPRNDNQNEPPKPAEHIDDVSEEAIPKQPKLDSTPKVQEEEITRPAKPSDSGNGSKTIIDLTPEKLDQAMASLGMSLKYESGGELATHSWLAQATISDIRLPPNVARQSVFLTSESIDAVGQVEAIRSGVSELQTKSEAREFFLAITNTIFDERKEARADAESFVRRSLGRSTEDVIEGIWLRLDSNSIDLATGVTLITYTLVIQQADSEKQQVLKREGDEEGARKLKLAIRLKDINPDAYRDRLQEIIEEYPETEAAKRAKALLEEQ